MTNPQDQNNRGDQSKQNFGNKVPDDKNKDMKPKQGDRGSEKDVGRDDRRNI
ncbi:MAG: hypothetical protein ACAH83_09315 [Alphaproteobacteria bacterium]